MHRDREGIYRPTDGDPVASRLNSHAERKECAPPESPTLPNERGGVQGESLVRPRLPLLVTGVSGVAGFNVWRALRERFGPQVWGLRQEKNWRLQHDGILVCDTEDLSGLRRLFRRHQFAAVLDCGGNCALRSCELDPAMAWRINCLAVQNLVAVLGEYPARFVRLSVDLVFSGQGNGGLREVDAVDPVTMYGKSMAAAEPVVLESGLNACVARISLPMGPSPNGHAGAIDWIESRFKQNKPATLYYDEIRTPTYTDCLTRVAAWLLDVDYRGLLHAGGPRALSLYQIGQIVNRVGGYAPHLLQGCFRNEAGPLPPRAGNVSLNSHCLRSLHGDEAFRPWPFDDRLVPTHIDWHWERTAACRGSRAELERLLYQPRLLGSPGSSGRRN